MISQQCSNIRTFRRYSVSFVGVGLSEATAAGRPGLARYYVLVSWATVDALAGYLRHGVPAVWEKAEGTR